MATNSLRTAAGTRTCLVRTCTRHLAAMAAPEQATAAPIATAPRCFAPAAGLFRQPHAWAVPSPGRTAAAAAAAAGGTITMFYPQQQQQQQRLLATRLHASKKKGGNAAAAAAADKDSDVEAGGDAEAEFIDEDDDDFVDDEDNVEEEEEGGEFEVGGGGFEAGGGDGEEDWAGSSAAQPEVNTGRTAWGEVALQSAQKVLEGPAGGGLELFSLTAVPQSKRLSIRLDKLADRYGSPSLDEVEAFCRAFNAEFEGALGEAEAGEVEIEVSSPGAERQVRVPGDLLRFQELPMKVEFFLGDEAQNVDMRVLQLVAVDTAAGTSQWKLANVRVNRQGGKGQQLTRKQRDQRFDIPLAQIKRANLFIDL